MEEENPSRGAEVRIRRVIMALLWLGVGLVVVDVAGASPFAAPGAIATVASVGLRVLAFSVALYGLWVHRDLRFVGFALMFGLMATRQTLTLLQRSGVTIGDSPLLTEIPGHLVSVLALLTVLYFLRAVPEARARAEFQELLHEEYERYRGMFEENTAVKLVVDPADGRIVEANAAAASFYGWTRPELESMTIDEIDCLPPDEVRAEMERARDAGKRLFRLRHRHRDGRVRDVEVHSGPIRVAGRTLLFSIVMDVTARTEAEEANARMVRALDAQARALAVARRDAETANRNKSAFLASMSHEIRTPMTAVLGFAESLRHPDLPDDDRREAIETIHESGEYLLRLINQILDLAKVESGKMDTEIVVVSVPGLLSGVHGMLAQRAAEAGLQFDVEIADRIPRDVATDELKVRQVLVNLVGNAIKYTDTGRVTLRVAHRADDDALIFRVEDTGPGLDERELERVFEPFVRVGPSESTPGTGLGLPLARHLAGLLGGGLTATSTPGVGSIFTFRLPAHRPEATPWIDEGADPLDREVPARDVRAPLPTFEHAVRVLVADDVRANRVLVRRLLERAGAEVESAEDGRQAVDAVRTAEAAGDPFDVVLMDVQMPVMDGMTATRILASEFPRLPVLALTAGVTRAELESLEDAGMRGRLAKPLDTRALLEAVELWSGAASEGVPSP